MGKSLLSMSWRSRATAIPPDSGRSAASVAEGASGRGLATGWAGGARPDLVEVPAEVSDLVSQLCRVLEAQVVGGGQHLLLELDDQLLDLLGAHLVVALLLAPTPARDLGLALHELGDVRDALDDRLGRD